jgi:ABC-type polysaccharide/polyol phosphate export permease
MIYIVKEILFKRSLIKELVLKDLKVRYSRPLLGFFWVILSPLLLVLIFYIVFSLFLKVKIREAPFLLYLMSAVFPWNFFQDSIMRSATSLVDNKNLIRESCFPHYLIPISIILANAINFLPSLMLLIICSGLLLKGLSIFIIFLPLVLITHLTITTGLSIMLSVLYVRWRDIRFILEAILVLLFYLTPAVYSICLVKNSFSPLLFKVYIYNPFVGTLNLYRSAVLRGFYSFIQKDLGALPLAIIPFVFAILVFLLGFYLYKKNKDIINDYLSY